MKDKPLKFCQSGQHYVSHLWHREKEGRPSACKNCSVKTPIKKSIETKPNKPITATKKKTEELSLKALKELCQTVVNRYTRKRDTRSDGTFQCYGCMQWFSAKLMDASHLISVKHQATRYDLMNINCCCQNCNRNLYGNLIEYRKNLVTVYGEQEILDLEARSKQIKKWTKEEILALIQKYKEWP